MKANPTIFHPRTALLLAAVALASPVSAARGPAASLAVSPSSVYLGESFTAEVRISGLDDDASRTPPSATLSLPKAAEIAGPAVSQQSFLSEINGRVTRESSVALSFRVTPTEPGDFPVEGATVRAGGRDVPCRGGAVVRVVGPEPSPYAEVALSASRGEVLVDEPFEVFADIVVRKLPAPFADASPLIFAPAFSVPHLQAPPAGEVDAPDVAQLLSPLVARDGGGGVSVNNVALRDRAAFPFGGAMPFGGLLSDPFERPRATTFALPREEATLRGEPAWRYRLAARFVPRAEGELSFSPVVLRGSVAIGVRDGNRAVPAEVFCRSEALSVRVVPPPAEGRPDSFCGTVGTSLAASASLDAQSCRQGDPVRLTLDLSGEFSQRAFRAPVLAGRPGVEGVFRVYDDVKTEPGPAPDSLRLTYTLRPLRAGTIELPPLDIAYYDTASNAYVVARTAPVPLRVAEVPAFDPDALFAAVEADDADIASADAATDDLPPAIVADPAPAGNRLLPAAIVRLCLALPALAAALALGRARRRLAPAQRRAARLRRAPRRAAHALRRARSLPDALAAIRAFFRDAHGIPAAAFTPADALDAAPAGIRPELAALLQPLYDQSFLAPDEADPALLSTVRERLPGLLARTLPASATARRPHSATLLPPLLGLASAALLLGFAALAASAAAALRASPGDSAVGPADRFLWEQAGSALAKASSPDDFLAAANAYRRLLADRPDLPGAWRNAGSALLLAQRPAEALGAFRRAEALAGSDPDLRHGLRASLRAQGRDIAWHRPLLAWLHAIPLRARAGGAALAWCLAWLAAIAGTASRRARPAARILALAALLAFAVLGSGALAAWHLVAAPLP